VPLNLLKKYPELLEISHMTETDRSASLRRVFNRDIQDNNNFSFRNKIINPVKGEDDAMDILFTHLITKIIDQQSRKREFDSDRSVRLNWIKHHVEENSPSLCKVFSVYEKNGIRTYIFDENKKYVIILEPYRDNLEYYLITAYYLKGRNYRKINNKYNRRLPDVK